jgi:CRP-like cAMP-binding protein
MSEASAEATKRLAEKLDRLIGLTPTEHDAITALRFKAEVVPANRYLVREGEVVSRCCMVIDGYACRQKIERVGRRQIVAFHMAGDILNLSHILLPRADDNLQTITKATVGWIATAQLLALGREYPRIAEAFAIDLLIDASIFREWVLNVGRRDAKARVAHMICEFIARRKTLDTSSSFFMTLPFTQEQIADATGLTAVHVNRMLRALTEEGAFVHQAGVLTIADWGKLQYIADFKPEYLHQAA